MNALTHWRIQRRSAVLLIPLTIWLIFSLSTLNDLSPATLRDWLNSPLQLSLLWLSLSVALFHGKLGMEVIFEDYVTNENQCALYKNLLKLTTILIWLFLTIAALVYLVG